MCLGAKYRKYKVQAELEGLPNYAGKAKQLWKFVITTILGTLIKFFFLSIVNTLK